MLVDTRHTEHCARCSVCTMSADAAGGSTDKESNFDLVYGMSTYSGMLNYNGTDAADNNTCERNAVPPRTTPPTAWFGPCIGT